MDQSDRQTRFVHESDITNLPIIPETKTGRRDVFKPAYESEIRN